MSAAKHTPGPWEVRASKGTVDFGIIVQDGRADGGWAVIAEAFSEVRHAGERAPEALPNARLIAAAPDLLEGGNAQTAILRRAQHILSLFISPDTRVQTADQCVSALLALLDGEEQRAAQAKWDAAIGKAAGSAA